MISRECTPTHPLTPFGSVTRVFSPVSSPPPLVRVSVARTGPIVPALVEFPLVEQLDESDERSKRLAARDTRRTQAPFRLSFRPTTTDRSGPTNRIFVATPAHHASTALLPVARTFARTLSIIRDKRDKRKG